MKRDPSELYHGEHCPVVPVPSAPPMAIPVYDADPQYQQALRQPLIPNDGLAVSVVYEPPTYNDHLHKKSCASMLFRLFAFHFNNTLLGLVAFGWLLIGVVLAIVTLPLCGCGVVVASLVLDYSRYCAELDIKLHNTVTSPKVYISIPERAVFIDMEVQRLAPSLMAASSRSFSVMLYYLTIKPLVSLLSLIVFVVAIALSCVCLVMISYPLMAITARLSRSLMVCFCCERFSARHHGSGGVRLEIGRRANHANMC